MNRGACDEYRTIHQRVVAGCFIYWSSVRRVNHWPIRAH